MARRISSALLVGLSIVASPHFVAAAEPAPAPRPLYPRFDLRYLPKIGKQGVIGIRPAAIAQYATEAEVKQASLLVQGIFSELLGAHETSGADLPTFDNLEECVFCLKLQFTAPKDDERAEFMLGGNTPCMMRTVQPFDWNTLLRKWFPKSTPARHAYRSYLKIPVAFPFTLPLVSTSIQPMAAYFPDDRTVVIGTEDQIQSLLDRIKEKKPAPTAPPGWSDVDRDVIAFALDNRDVPLVKGKFPVDYFGGRAVELLAGSLQTLSFGISVGDYTRIRLVATARNDNQARVVAENLKNLCSDMLDRAAEERHPDPPEGFGVRQDPLKHLRWLAEENHPDPLEAFVVALLKCANFGREGKRVTGTLAADGNLIKLLFTMMRGPA